MPLQGHGEEEVVDPLAPAADGDYCDRGEGSFGVVVDDESVGPVVSAELVDEMVVAEEVVVEPLDVPLVVTVYVAGDEVVAGVVDGGVDIVETAAETAMRRGAMDWTFGRRRGVGPRPRIGRILHHAWNRKVRG